MFVDVCHCQHALVKFDKRGGTEHFPQTHHIDIENVIFCTRKLTLKSKILNMGLNQRKNMLMAVFVYLKNINTT